MYGRDPPPLIKGISTALPNSEVDRQLIDHDSMLVVLREHLVHTQQQMKNIADRHRRDLSFEVGELVYLKVRPHRLLSLGRRVNEKLAPRFYGPFPALKHVGKVAYKLQLPVSPTIHPVFHISQLCPAVGSVPLALDLPVQLSQDMELLLEPEDVLGYCSTGSSLPHDVEVLIKWKDLPAHESSWEPYILIQNQFPSFHLEDKEIPYPWKTAKYHWGLLCKSILIPK